ncbi:MAG: cation diffusion facilitator family transporter [Chloroflexota bacterium]
MDNKNNSGGHDYDQEHLHEHSHDHGHGHVHDKKGGHAHGGLLHSHGRAHSIGGEESGGGKLAVAAVINSAFAALEFFGGAISGSLALMSDATHNAGDAASLIAAYFASKISKRSSNEQKTFGWRRAEILTALLNAAALLAICALIVREAIVRLYSNDATIDLGIMFWVALAGLGANLFSVLILRHSHGLNERVAVLHLIGDTLSSVAVVVGAVIMYYTGVRWFDAAISLIIALYIAYESWKALKITADILMQAAPKGIDLADIEREMLKETAIHNIHHVHFWQLTETRYHFECHIDLREDIPVSETCEISARLELALRERFGITHFTFQWETDNCMNKSIIAGRKQ